jgi:hypothetical protein
VGARPLKSECAIRLLHGTWRKQSMQSEVGDWERYIKERARMLVAARLAGQTLEPSEVSVAIARFNLVANWCTSEVGYRFLTCVCPC